MDKCVGGWVGDLLKDRWMEPKIQGATALKVKYSRD